MILVRKWNITREFQYTFLYVYDIYHGITKILKQSYNFQMSLKIYFAGSIRGGRDDAELYAQMIKTLQSYGTVLTEMVGYPNIVEMGAQTIEQLSSAWNVLVIHCNIRYRRYNRTHRERDSRPRHRLAAPGQR